MSIPELSIATCPAGSHDNEKTSDGVARMVMVTSMRSMDGPHPPLPRAVPQRVRCGRS